MTDKITALAKGGPEGHRFYVIGDVHGLLGPLNALLDAILADLRDRPTDSARVISLGDLVDRGPQSKEVVARMMAPPEGLPPLTVLMGNHESLFLDFLNGRPLNGRWMGPRGGGAETLRSYGVTPPAGHETDSHVEAEVARARRDALKAVPADHWAFLESLPLTVEAGDLLFVHAGVDPTRPLAEQDPNDLIWIREPFLSWSAPWERLVVHGHTPRPEVETTALRLGLDTGAYLGGPLTAAVIEGRESRLLSVPGQAVPTPNTWG